MTIIRDAYRIIRSMRALYKCKVNGKSNNKTSHIVSQDLQNNKCPQKSHSEWSPVNDTKEMKLRQKLFPLNPHVLFPLSHSMWAFESNCQLVSSPNGWVRYPPWAFSGLITIIGGIRRIVSQGAKLARPLMIAVWALLINCGCREIWTRFFSSLAFQHCLHPASRNPSQISRWHHLTLISD